MVAQDYVMLLFIEFLYLLASIYPLSSLGALEKEIKVLKSSAAELKSSVFKLE